MMNLLHFTGWRAMELRLRFDLNVALLQSFLSDGGHKHWVATPKWTSGKKMH